MNNPSVLLVDEPTSALDQERGASIIDLIPRLTDELNTSTLLVTHDLVHLPACTVSFASSTDDSSTWQASARPERTSGASALIGAEAPSSGRGSSDRSVRG